MSALYATHLDLLLDRLESGYLSAVEYAGPAVAGVHTSIFQIRLLTTVDGMQFAVRTWDRDICENWTYFPTTARADLAREVQSLVARANRDHLRTLIQENGREASDNGFQLPFSLRGVVSLRARDAAQAARRDEFLLDRLARRWSNDE